jgi:hypothetical protein
VRPLPGIGGRVRSRARRARSTVNRTVARAAARAGLGHYVVLDYPAAAAPPRRRGEGPLFDLIDGSTEEYARTLRMLASYEDDLARIPCHTEDERAPAWINQFLPGTDAAAIYGFLRSRAPRTFLEIGSGNSTRFARRAIEDGGLKTRIVSIDPSPRAPIAGLSDQVISEPLELAPIALFETLQPGDVVFLDGSHRVFTGSDVTVFFLDLLPELPTGVLVGIHDVNLPDDYPAEIQTRHYSEQYVLAGLLLGRPEWLRLVLAADFAGRIPELASELSGLWRRLDLRGPITGGVAFWFEIDRGTGG